MSNDLNTLAAPVCWGGGTQIRGTPFRVAVTAEATEGRAVVITVDMPPGVHVDEHTSADEDQLMIVVSGRVGTNVGGMESALEAGGVQLLPRGVPHALWNAGDEFAKIVEIYTPPGMEQRFAQAAAAALASASPAALSTSSNAPSPNNPPTAGPSPDSTRRFNTSSVALAAPCSPRALLDDAVGHAWAAVCEGTPAGVEHQDRMTLALHHAMDVALDCVDVAYRFAGTAVVRAADPIQRCFRDLHTARKHLVYGLNGYRGVARHTLGVT